MQSTLLTVEQASRIGLPIVYGLHDMDGLFYVGKTTSPRVRFKSHSRAAGHNNLHLARRINQAGDGLRIEVIALMPRDLAKAETDAILANADKLVNKVWNPYRACIQVPYADAYAARVNCPICDGPMDHRNSRHCAKCVEKLVAPGGMSKAELRELANKAVAEFKAR